MTPIWLSRDMVVIREQVVAAEVFGEDDSVVHLVGGRMLPTGLTIDELAKKLGLHSNERPKVAEAA